MNELEGNEHQGNSDGDIQQPPAPIERLHAAANNPASGKQGEEKKTNWAQRIEAVCAVLLVVITGTYTYYSAGQLHKMRRSVQAAEGANRIAGESLQSVQRAFVFLGEPTVIRVPKGKEFDFYVRFPWGNSGSTPTKSLTTHTNWQANPIPITRDFPFADFWNEGEPHVDGQTLIGPHGSIGNNMGPISSRYIVAVQQHKIHLYFWGHAKYRDTFENTPEHLTRFCTELVGFFGDPFGPPGKDAIFPVINDCGFYTCADSECKN